MDRPAAVSRATLTAAGLVIVTGFVGLPSGGQVLVADGRLAQVVVTRLEWDRETVTAELAQLVGRPVYVGEVVPREDGRFEAPLYLPEHLAELADDGHPAAARYVDHVQPGPVPPGFPKWPAVDVDDEENPF